MNKDDLLARIDALEVMCDALETRVQMLTLSLGVDAWKIRNEAPPVAPDLGYMVTLAARHFGIELADLQGKNRCREFALRRHAIAYCIRQTWGDVYSDQAIGGMIGRDRTSIIHGANKIKQHRLNPQTLPEDERWILGAITSFMQQLYALDQPDNA